MPPTGRRARFSHGVMPPRPGATTAPTRPPAGAAMRPPGKSFSSVTSPLASRRLMNTSPVRSSYRRMSALPSGRCEPAMVSRFQAQMGARAGVVVHLDVGDGQGPLLARGERVAAGRAAKVEALGDVPVRRDGPGPQAPMSHQGPHVARAGVPHVGYPSSGSDSIGTCLRRQPPTSPTSATAATRARLGALTNIPCLTSSRRAGERASRRQAAPLRRRRSASRWWREHRLAPRSRYADRRCRHS